MKKKVLHCEGCANLKRTGARGELLGVPLCQAFNNMQVTLLALGCNCKKKTDA